MSINKILLALTLGLGLGLASAQAQTSLPASQVQAPTLNLSTTIAVTNTFQSIQSVNLGRRGCHVQNNATNNQWVFFGPIASATKAASILLTPGASVFCNTPGLILTDQISITGTATDSFYAGVQ